MIGKYEAVLAFTEEGKSVVKLKSSARAKGYVYVDIGAILNKQKKLKQSKKILPPGKASLFSHGVTW